MEQDEALWAAKGALFDLDGTLVDSNEFHVVAWAEACREFSLSISRYAIRQQIGKGADTLVATLFPELEEPRAKALGDAHGKIFRERFIGLVKPFPGAGELIRALAAKGCRVVFASSSVRKDVEHYAELLDVQSSLAAVVSLDDVSQSKPARDVFAVALEKAKLAPNEAIAVGDTPYDAIAAGKCGVRTVALRSGGYSDPELRAHNPLAIVTEIGDLLRF